MPELITDRETENHPSELVSESELDKLAGFEKMLIPPMAGQHGEGFCGSQRRLWEPEMAPALQSL